MKIKALFAGALLLASAAFAQTTIGPAVPHPPQITSIGVNDVFQDVVGGMPVAGNYYVGAPNMAGFFSNGMPGLNFLIGGKADQNLWQRATTGSSVTTTLTYGGPDRWAYWSGTNTAMTVSKVTTAAALPVGSANVFRMQRTASQTGVVQMCMAQEIATRNSLYLQGHTVLLDLNVYTGANFSGTGMTAYISYGTGTDEGLAGSASYANGLNAGGGGSGSWTGQANATAAVIPLSAVSTAYRVAAVASIPSTATEIAVALCYTPVGTAGTTDALYFDNIELRKADALSNFVNATAGYVLSSNVMTASVNGATQNATVPAFTLRPYEEEQRNQLAYYYQINESAVIFPIANCAASSTSLLVCYLQFPVTMRTTPTMSYTNGFAGSLIAQTSLVACATIVTSTAVTSSAANPQGVPLGCTSSGAFTGDVNGTATMLFSNNGSGVIKASAEL